MTQDLRSRVPHIVLGYLPPDEQRLAAGDLVSQLYRLAGYVDDFRSALDLFDDSETRARHLPKYRNRKHLAARDGALTLFHFEKTLHSVGPMVHKCPTLEPFMPPKALKAARKMFRAAVPDAENVRHGVAHAAEFAHESDKHKATSDVTVGSHMVAKVGPGSSMYMSGNLFDRHFSATVGGKVVSYELNSETLQTLVKVTEAVFDAIQKATQDQVNVAILAQSAATKK